MKYLLDIELPPEITEKRMFVPGDTVAVQGEKLILRNADDNSNDAGFGWLWAYNPNTNVYRYKISMFDGRTIPPETDIPSIGVSNYTAYNMLQFQLVKEYSFELSWQAVFNLVKGFFNGLFSKFRRRSSSS